MEYFDHNVNASDDDAIMALRLEHGGEAVDCYWAIIEKIYREERPFETDENQPGTKSVAHRLNIGIDLLQEYVSSMVLLGLLYAVENDPLQVMSARADATIERFHQRQETARQNGKKHTSEPTKKPSRKQVGSKKQPKSATIKTEQNRSIGSYKNEPNTYGNTPISVSAEAETGDSQTQGKCPDCGSVTYRKTSRSGAVSWFCPRCHESKKEPIEEGTACPEEVRKAVLS